MASSLMVFIAFVVAAFAGVLLGSSRGPIESADGPIGSPCFANESAIELFTTMNLAGRVAVVTGGDVGIGLEVARALAARRATVVLPGRNLTKMRRAARDIMHTVPNADVFVPELIFDLSSFALVRGVAESLKRFPAIHILVNNAGLSNNPLQLTTVDGMELAFQADYPSHWLFTHLLLPQLRAGRGRIVNVASKAAALACQMSKRPDCLSLDRLPPPVITSAEPVPILGLRGSNYGIAKLLMIRWTEDLARREAEAGSGVTAFSLHPGFVKTSMAEDVSPFFSKFACLSDGRTGAPCPTTPAQGALTPTFLALSPDVQHDSGGYFEWCFKLEGPSGGRSQAYKDGIWNLTEKWVENFSMPLLNAEFDTQEPAGSDPELV